MTSVNGPPPHWSLHADLYLDCDGRSATIQALGQRVVIDAPDVKTGWWIGRSLLPRGRRLRVLRRMTAQIRELGIHLEVRVRDKCVLVVGVRQNIPLRLFGMPHARLRLFALVRQLLIR